MESSSVCIWSLLLAQGSENLWNFRTDTFCYSYSAPVAHTWVYANVGTPGGGVPWTASGGVVPRGTNAG